MSSEFERATALQSIGDGEAKPLRGERPRPLAARQGRLRRRRRRASRRVRSPSPRPTAGGALRSLSAELCAPALPGPVEVEVTSLRRGASMSFVDARLTQGDALIAHASAALASPRAVAPAAIRPVPPRRPPWRDVATIPVEAPLGPVFAQEVRVPLDRPAAVLEWRRVGRRGVDPREGHAVRPRRGGDRGAARCVVARDPRDRVRPPSGRDGGLHDAAPRRSALARSGRAALPPGARRRRQRQLLRRDARALVGRHRRRDEPADLRAPDLSAGVDARRAPVSELRVGIALNHVASPMGGHVIRRGGGCEKSLWACVELSAFSERSDRR